MNVRAGSAHRNDLGTKAKSSASVGAGRKESGQQLLLPPPKL
eukprot:CAMPEP_0202063578 /NCGR_PEP_ID=MMETSP0963-20130614/46831_1 /ASSEMBLY_ACC=CAM_ASM_000494 /TAXON_ID=4773 /ORGANISM="Schizochytrium aggregatum, Strain ATCC28209" /LENGTH=41 /DNA_ID= /DNA_START= /DNA_END= /DNA_ORIENTATION=